jgi:hypothetical protein
MPSCADLAIASPAAAAAARPRRLRPRSLRPAFRLCPTPSPTHPHGREAAADGLTREPRIQSKPRCARRAAGELGRSVETQHGLGAQEVVDELLIRTPCDRAQRVGMVPDRMRARHRHPRRRPFVLAVRRDMGHTPSGRTGSDGRVRHAAEGDYETLSAGRQAITVGPAIASGLASRGSMPRQR